MKKITALLLALLMISSFASCGKDDDKGEANKDGFTITNQILGEDYKFTYDKVPQKVVSLASPATEMLLALGVEDKIAGYAMQDNVIPDKYKAAFDSLTLMTDGWTISKETILSYEPDFMMFWNGSADYDYEFLKANNILTYTMTSDIDGAKLEAIYDDFTNMGKIFGKEERAAEIIGEMKAKIDPIREALKDVTPVKVAYVDAYSTDSAAFTAGDALVADIFRIAGGENVLNEQNDAWYNVSWEKIAEKNPECIVIGIYEGVEDADYWKDFLKNHPAMSKTDAVMNEKYIIVGLADLTVGERVADTVGMLAKEFHPDKIQ